MTAFGGPCRYQYNAVSGTVAGKARKEKIAYHSNTHRSAGGVDEGGAVTRLDVGLSGLHLLVRHRHAQHQEFRPGEHPLSGLLGELVVHRLSPHHDGLDGGQGGRDGSILFQLLVVLQYNYLGLAVLADVVACLRHIGGVDTRRDAAGEDRAVVRDEPLGGVEADDVDGLEARDLQVDQGLGEGRALIVILLPRPRAPLAGNDSILGAGRGEIDCGVGDV